MRLTLAAQNITVEMHSEEFSRLRKRNVSTEEIDTIAASCGIDSSLLRAYVNELDKPEKELLEIDASCDYSDQL